MPHSLLGTKNTKMNKMNEKTLAHTLQLDHIIIRNMIEAEVTV